MPKQERRMCIKCKRYVLHDIEPKQVESRGFMTDMIEETCCICKGKRVVNTGRRHMK